MKIAKPTPKMFEAVREFIDACEGVLERQKWSLTSPEDEWESGWDEDNEDRIELMAIKENIAQESGCDISDVDNRAVCYEWLKRKYCNRLSHISMTADVLLDNCCDPTDDCLAFYPGIQILHVAPEQ